MSGTRNMNAEYVSGKIKEQGLCHTVRERLGQHQEVCNFTLDNSGMPWYCVAPKSKNLICQDWMNMKMQVPYPNVPFNKMEEQLVNRGMVTLPGIIKVNVKARTPNAISSRSTMVPCTHFNTTELWYKREPTGYFYQGRWYIRHCQAKELPQFKDCLRNRRVMYFGDSTTRQWYMDMPTRFSCPTVSEEWTVKKWHKPSKCHNKGLNLTVLWLPHSQPLYVGTNGDFSRHSTVSIDRRIDEEIGDNDNDIVVLHMYMHVLAYRPEVFEIKMRRIRKSIDRLLARNKMVKVFIKGPHTFKDKLSGYGRLSDYFGYFYRQILFHVFEGLHEKVIYLDHKDITNALQIVPNHPPENVVTAMVDQMLSYIC